MIYLEDLNILIFYIIYYYYYYFIYFNILIFSFQVSADVLEVS